MSVRIGITGGIGSGKSIVSRILRSMGIPVYDCDAEAKRIMNCDSVVRKRLTEHFGEECYSGANGLNRKYLADCIFGDAEKLLLVNSIVHPRVKDDFVEWCGKMHGPIVAVESAILFEAGFADTVDYTVCVHADREICIDRVCKRNAMQRDEVVQRIERQTPVQYLIAKSDYSVVNNPHTPILPQIHTIIADINSQSLKILKTGKLNSF